MIAGFRRTAIAFVLVSAAVGLPSLAWYVAGSREHERDTQRRIEDARRSARDASRRLAASLASRLEALRKTESGRPFYHYQNLYHDPKGAHDGPSVIPSPLADGPIDPLVRVHFQVDPYGSVGLPTLNPDVPELNAGPSSVEQRDLLELVEACADDCRVSATTRAFVARRGETLRIEPATLGVPDTGRARGAWRRVWIDEAAWIQNRNASELFVDLKGWDGSAHCSLKAETEEASRGSVKIAVEIGPFHWRTVAFGKRPELAALREVRTPDGSYSQGWIVDRDRIAGWLERSGAEVSFVPAGSTGLQEAVLPIHGTEWAIAVDEARVIADTRSRSSAEMVEFRTRFVVAVGAAWLVGLCVVGLVWQAERLAQQRSRFAASAAHELRTPLASLRMYGEMLAERLGDPTRTEHYAQRIASESERLGRVVSNVLGFARLERGMLRVRCERGDLSSAILECTRGQRRTLETAGVALRMDLPSDLPEVAFDRDALFHVLQNLLDNAEKYTRTSEDRTVTVRVDRRDGALEVAVEDRGPGVAQEERGSLFRPFVRGRRDDAPAGLGLGLVLSRALARSMGGELGYTDRPGGGSRFVLSLPF